MNAAIDYTQPLTYLKTICSECRKPVTYANTVLVSTPVVPAPKYPGQTTHIVRRVCSTH